MNIEISESMQPIRSVGGVLSAFIFLTFFSTMSHGLSCGAALSLLEVQKEAQKNGVTFVVDPIGRRRLKGQSEGEKLLYGAPVIHVRDSKPPEKPKKLDGVVIYLGDARKLSKYYRGKIELTRDTENSDLKIENNKWIEYLEMEKIVPGAMPRSVNGKDLVEKYNRDDFMEQQKLTFKSVDEYLKSDRLNLSETETSAIHRLVRLFFNMSKQEFPEGAFIKNVTEAQTGDTKDLIRTFKEPAKIFSQKFIDDMTDLKKKNIKPRFGLDDTQFEIELSWIDHSASLLVVSLMNNLEGIMVQEKLDIAQIEGKNAEVRVNFAGGIVLSAETRETLGYMPEQLEQAKIYLANILRKFPANKRKKSGGADVYFLKDGTIRLGERNPGADTGDIHAPTEPITANTTLSEITGKPTVLTDSLEALFQKSFLNGSSVLKGFSEVNRPEKKRFKDSYVVAVAEWLRDRYMVEWKKNPSDDNGLLYLAQLRGLLKHDNSLVQKELNHLYSGAKEYMYLYKLGVTETRFQYQYGPR